MPESAIKVHAQRVNYRRERNAYLRLRDHRVHQINNLTVPELFRHDDGRLILEMSLVRPPFILDFGGAYLDNPPPHMTELEIRENWLQDKREQFGQDWGRVEEVLAKLDSLYGIFLADINRGNLDFGVWPAQNKMTGLYVQRY